MSVVHIFGPSREDLIILVTKASNLNLDIAAPALHEIVATVGSVDTAKRICRINNEESSVGRLAECQT